jgi:hypothetical protein
MAVTNASGKLEGLPIIPPPEAQVIDASVSVNVAPGGVCPGPISLAFSGSITTNGPATVTYRWEIRGDTTLTSSSESHVFAKADTWTFSSDHLHLSCGSFRVILHILTPNDFRAEKRFRLSSEGFIPRQGSHRFLQASLRWKCAPIRGSYSNGLTDLQGDLPKILAIPQAFLGFRRLVQGKGAIYHRL